MRRKHAVARVWTAALIIVIVAAAAVVVFVETRPGTTDITTVSWNNPSHFCLPTTSTHGSKGQPGMNTTVSLSVGGNNSELQGCYVPRVTVNTPGFSLVSSNAPGIIGTWTPLSVTVRNPSGGYTGSLNITVDVASVPLLAIASSNFQLNSTGGTLFATFVNIGNSTISVSQFAYDNQTVNSSNSDLESSCTNVPSEQSCTVTLYFGDGLLPLPAQDSDHQLNLVADSGASMSYTVTAGELEQQAWASEE